MIEPGDVLLGRYEIRKLAGHGGMADVYLAYDRKRRAAVAVKVLHEDLAEDPEFVRRFEREADALARLDHPNIVRFYGFEQQGRVAFIVMDYISGSTLRGRLRDAGGPLPLVKVRSILEQVVAALHYAHEGGLIHRDIKPGNIMLKEDGTALLSDFGIARAAEATTLTAGPLGTPPYMSPEQILGRVVDERTDVYSLGVVAYEMLAGRRPFVGESAGAPTSSTAERIRWEHLHGTPVPLRQINPSLPAKAEAAVVRALAKDPQARWSSVASFWDVLGVALSGEGQILAPAVSPAPVAPVQHRAATQTPPHQTPLAPRPDISAPPARHRPAGLLAAGGVLSVGVVLVGLWIVLVSGVQLPIRRAIPATTGGATSPPLSTALLAIASEQTPTPRLTAMDISTQLPVPTLTAIPTVTLTETPSPTTTQTQTPTLTATHTETPTPTATYTETLVPTPNASPTPTATATAFAMIQRDGTSIRTGPSTAYSLVGTAPKGAAFVVVARSPDGGWLRLDGSDQRWIPAEVAATTGDLPVATALPPVPSPVPVRPGAAILLSPNDGYTAPKGASFQWRYSGPALSSNQGFELLLWQDGVPGQPGAAPIVAYVPNARYVYTITSGDIRAAPGIRDKHLDIDVRWTVAVVQRNPYRRITIASSRWIRCIISQ